MKSERLLLPVVSFHVRVFAGRDQISCYWNTTILSFYELHNSDAFSTVFRRYFTIETDLIHNKWNYIISRYRLIVYLYFTIDPTIILFIIYSRGIVALRTKFVKFIIMFTLYTWYTYMQYWILYQYMWWPKI